MVSRHWMAVAGLWGALAVALGALGAHAVRHMAGNWPEPSRQQRLDNWETAARYQLAHALAIAAASVTAAGTTWGHAAAAALGGGNLLFSGCLYAYAWTGNPLWALPVPLGGMVQLAGWLLMSVAALSMERPGARDKSSAHATG